MTKIIVALDVDSHQKARKLVNRLKGWADMFKVGLFLFSRAGPNILKTIKKYNEKVFLDLKFFDIPSIVEKACESCLKWQVDMFNLHILGGYEMLKRASDFVFNYCEKKKIKERPKIIGVTLLTSFREDSLMETLNIEKEKFQDMVVKLSLIAKKANLDGVVASPRDIKRIKEECGKDFLVISPGIRIPEIEIAKDDQERTMTPKEAAEAGADYIVIGRPILKAEDPIELILKIKEEIKEINEKREN
ncbi:MAG: orotidine-5'-phosphate decarboxylase [candidate division WOR-3 bacterium]|nr:orotidine-5'-phosphate decarboxylase [candidate division WOR-3 bacterium]MCX7837227.1 orotidine-5'-phosphate decarboxylase [candidate division WOR-3 bacterium]MDW8113438.1 orotidine-5'-phosphate decarboxylase [candidate division WOR-3 bacterium]